MLIAEGKTYTHRFVQDSGWTSFPIQSEADLKQAQWLMRLSYLMNVARYGRGKQSFDLASAIDDLNLSHALRETAFPKHS